LAPFLPTQIQRIAPKSWVATGIHLLNGNSAENGSYIGIPILVLLVLIILVYRRQRWVLFAAAMTVIAFVLSLGPRLTVDNHRFNLPLPFAIFNRLPVLDSLLAARFSLYQAFFIAVLVAIGFDSFVAGFRRRGAVNRAAGIVGTTVSRILGAEFVVVVAIAGILSWVPSWPIYTTPNDMPVYFTSSAVDRIPVGSVVLISPYPSVAQILPQEWQSLPGMRYKIIGGYGFFTEPSGVDSGFPAKLNPEDVETYLNAQVSPFAFPNPTPPAPTALLTRQFRSFLLRYHVGTVLFIPLGVTPQSIAAVHSLFVRALGPASTKVGQGMTEAFGPVEAWYDVSKLVATHR
jgi:hypothetical protein